MSIGGKRGRKRKPGGNGSGGSVRQACEEVIYSIALARDDNETVLYVNPGSRS